MRTIGFRVYNLSANLPVATIAQTVNRRTHVLRFLLFAEREIDGFMARVLVSHPTFVT